MNRFQTTIAAVFCLSNSLLALGAEQEPQTDSAAALALYSEAYEMSDANDTLADILKDAREKVSLPEYDSLLNAQKTLQAIHAVVHRRTLIKEDCVDRALRYLAVAEELGIKLRVFAAGDHVYVSLKGSYYDLGWEPNHGKRRNHSSYKSEYSITDEEIKNEVFLVPLNRQALQSVVYLDVALKHTKNNDAEKAFAAVEKAIECNPKSPLAWAFRGDLHSEAGRQKQAIADYKKTVSLFSGHDNALWKLAMLLNQHDDYKGSVAVLDKLLKLYPLNETVRETREFIKDKQTLDAVIERYRAERPRGERLFFAFPGSGKVHNVSRTEEGAHVLPDWEKISALPFSEEAQVFVLHNHAMSKQTYTQLLGLAPAERERVLKLDQKLFDGRTFIEVPSPPLHSGGDLQLALMGEAKVLECSPRTHVRQFIVCFRESDFPQVVEFGLSPKARWDYRELLKRQQEKINTLKRTRETEPEGSKKLSAAIEDCREAIEAAEDFERTLLRAYRDAWTSYAQTVRLPRHTPEELEKRVEPSLDAFSKELKRTSDGMLFVKNYGAFPRHYKGLLH